MTVTRLTLSDVELEALYDALGIALSTYGNVRDDQLDEYVVMGVLRQRILHTLGRMRGDDGPHVVPAERA